MFRRPISNANQSTRARARIQVLGWKVGIVFLFLSGCKNSRSERMSDNKSQNQTVASCPQSYSIPLKLLSELSIDKSLLVDLRIGSDSHGQNLSDSILVPPPLSAYEADIVRKKLMEIYPKISEQYLSQRKGQISKARKALGGAKSHISDQELDIVFQYSGRGTYANNLLRNRSAGSDFNDIVGQAKYTTVNVEAELLFLLSGILKMDRFEGVVFRSMKTMPESLLAQLKECQRQKRPYVEPAFLATSESPEIFENKDFRGEVKMYINSRNGRRVSSASLYKSTEAEVLFAPGSSFCISSIRERGLLTRSYEIRLEQVENPSDACSK